MTRKLHKINQLILHQEKDNAKHIYLSLTYLDQIRDPLRIHFNFVIINHIFASPDSKFIYNSNRKYKFVNKKKTSGLFSA